MTEHVNVDRIAAPGVDLIHDLDVAPWPWGDGSVEGISARDVFEHVTDPVLFMRECHRVLIPGGDLWIRTPNVFLSPSDAFTDPTHRRFPTWNTFDYWIEGTPYYEAQNQAYGGVSFTLAYRGADDGSMVVTLIKHGPGSGSP